jgi:hypothetical protein
MILKLNDRIEIMKMLPKNGDTVEMLLKRCICKRLEIDSTDVAECDIKTKGEGISWSLEKDKGKEYIFNSKELELLKKSVANLESTKQVDDLNLDACLAIKEAV